MTSDGEVAGAGLLAITSLVVWFLCLVTGTLGMLLPYALPQLPAKPPDAVQTEILNVQVIDDPAPALEAQPPAPGVSAPREAPPLPAVAQPSPAVAFALPVEGPVQVVEIKQADFARPAQARIPAPTPTTFGPLRKLTYGQGEGMQPDPEYPREAVTAGQQGAVGIHLFVDEEGRVSAAEVFSPCPWPLLNQSAVRAVRESWRFRSGPRRAYEVYIDFELNQK